MTNNSPELQFLRDEVARTFGSRLETSTDFDALSVSIEARIGSLISVSTLKRLWGYVRPQARPRMSTLDLLAQYTGRDSYAALCRDLLDTSGFISAERVDAASLGPGTELQLSWIPDRTVRLKSLGGKRFRVVDPGNSKLKSGDEFEASTILKGHPLYIDGILRNGSPLPPYVAGRSGGLTDVKLL